MISWLSKNVALLISLPIFIILKLFINVIYAKNINEKNKVDYLFFSPQGYKGNTRYLYDYFLNQGDSVNCLYITKEMLQGKHFFKLAYYLIFSKAIFLTHGLGKLPLTVFFTRRIQLWHGLPIKKLLLDASVDTEKYQSKILNKLYKRVYKLRIWLSYNLLITSDGKLGYALSQAFNFTNTANVKYLGTPSISFAYTLNDDDKTNDDYKTNDGSSLKVLYLPTWRDGDTVILDIVKEMCSCLSKEYLVENKIELYIKLHPYDLALLDDILQDDIEIKILRNDIEDLVTYCNEFDCLITDYSSACFEFYPLNKPMIFYTPDYDAYCSSRGFYLDIRVLSQGRMLSTIDELKKHLELIKDCPADYLYDWNNVIGNNKNSLKDIYTFIQSK